MKTAFVYWGAEPHPRRAADCRAIGADFHQIELYNRIRPFGEILPNLLMALKLFFSKKYDVLLVDSGVSLQTAYFLKKFFRKKIKVIFLVPEPFYYGDYLKNKLRARIHLELSSVVDGFISACDFITDEINSHFNLPVVEVYPHISRDEKPLLDIKPDFDKKDFLYIGHHRREKGIDVLLDVYREVVNKSRDKHKLYVLGRKTKEKIKDEIKGLVVVGNADPIVYLRKTSFLLHPARYEPGPIVILEAMASGVIPVVSDYCGHSRLVKELDPKLVFRPCTKEKMLKSLNYALSLNKSKLKQLSKKAKRISRDHTIKKGVARFRKNFFLLLDMLDKKKKGR